MDEAVALATGFQTSLQDTINWLTQAEQTLNMAQPPSLILDTVLFQIDEHKVLNMFQLLVLLVVVDVVIVLQYVNISRLLVLFFGSKMMQ